MEQENKNIGQEESQGFSETKSTTTNVFPVKKKSKKKWVVLGIGVLIAAGVFMTRGLWMPGPSDDAVAASVMTAEIADEDVIQKVSLRAPVTSTDRAEVRSMLSGKITKTTVKLGDHVNKNQLLATVDDKSVRDEIASAAGQAQLSQLNMNDALKKSQEAYDELQRNLKDAEKKLNDAKELLASGAVPEADVAAAQKAFDGFKDQIATYVVANGKVQPTAAQRKGIALQREQAGRLSSKLENANMLSPIAGTITRMEAKEGQTTNGLQDTAPLFVIENMDQLEMKIKVSEYDIAKIKVGQSVKITADVLAGKSVEGKVAAIALSGEKKDQSSNEMVIPVTIKIADKGGLIPGITAKAEVITAEANKVLAVPAGAIFQDPITEEYSVFVVGEDSTLKKIPVQRGVVGDIKAEISGKDLKAGMKIVASPDASTMEGMKVKVMDLSQKEGAPDNAAKETVAP